MLPALQLMMPQAMNNLLLAYCAVISGINIWSVYFLGFKIKIMRKEDTLFTFLSMIFVTGICICFVTG